MLASVSAKLSGKIYALLHVGRDTLFCKKTIIRTDVEQRKKFKSYEEKYDMLSI